MGRARSGLVLVLGLTVSCSLDWSIGGDAGGRAEAGDARGGDGARGSGGSAGAGDSSVDQTVPGDTGSPDTGRVADVEPDVSCAALLATLDRDRFAAQVCSGSSCKSTVMDQCGCLVVVAQPSSAATAAYVAAIAAFKVAGCPACGSTCPKHAPAACLPVYVMDSGLTTVCTAT